MASSHRDLTRDQPRVAPGGLGVPASIHMDPTWKMSLQGLVISEIIRVMHHWFFVASPGSPGSLGAPMNIEVYWSQYQPIYVKLSQSQYIVIYNLYICVCVFYMSICHNIWIVFLGCVAMGCCQSFWMTFWHPGGGWGGGELHHGWRISFPDWEPFATRTAYFEWSSWWRRIPLMRTWQNMAKQLWTHLRKHVWTILNLPNILFICSPQPFDSAQCFSMTLWPS